MKTVIPSLYIRTINNALEKKNNDPICEVSFFTQKSKHFKTHNICFNSLTWTYTATLIKYIWKKLPLLGRLYATYWVAIWETHFQDQLKQSEDLGMKHRSWPQGNKVSCPLVGKSISKASAATKGGHRAWNSTKGVDKPHLVNTGKKGEKYCQRQINMTSSLPPPTNIKQKKTSGG